MTMKWSIYCGNDRRQNDKWQHAAKEQGAYANAYGHCIEGFDTSQHDDSLTSHRTDNDTTIFLYGNGRLI